MTPKNTLGPFKTIGIISDTHGLLRPSALQALTGVQMIIHAGDIGDFTILDRLRELAPVIAVRGNTDNEPWACQLARSELVELDGFSLYVLHDIYRLDLAPEAAGIHAVIYGHFHVPVLEWKRGVLFLNPGSAGPRRSTQPASVALIRLLEGSLQPELIELPE